MLSSTASRITAKGSFFYSRLQNFDTFICNNKHRFVLAALHELASGKSKGKFVLLHGDSGTGKTHLLHAFSTECLHNGFTPSPVIQLGGFADNKSVSEIKNFDVLIVDDVHTVQSVRTYEIFQTIMDAFFSKNALILIAGTGNPKGWSLPKSIRSRLNRGIKLELPLTDLDISLRFADIMAKEYGLVLTRDQKLDIVRASSDLRQLSGIIEYLELYMRLNTGALPKNRLSTLLAEHHSQSFLQHNIIIDIVAKRLGISGDAILSHSKKTNHVFARQIAMYLCRTVLGLSYPAIGAVFNGMNHSTVIHAVKKIKNFQHDNKDTNNLVTELTNLYRQHDG